MLRTDSPARPDVVGRVSGLRPLVSRHAAWAEQNRRIHDEVIEALADAGVFKLRTPARYGGYEADTRTLVDVGTELGRADGSTAWTASVYWIPTWMAGLFPQAVQDEVFATPDVRICGTLSPSAQAAPVDGGVVVNGRWGFISGAHHSQWQEIVAVAHLGTVRYRQRDHGGAGRVRARRAGTATGCDPAGRRRQPDPPRAAAAGRVRVLGRYRAGPGEGGR